LFVNVTAVYASVNVHSVCIYTELELFGVNLFYSTKIIMAIVKSCPFVLSTSEQAL